MKTDSLSRVIKKSSLNYACFNTTTTGISKSSSTKTPESDKKRTSNICDAQIPAQRLDVGTFYLADA